VGDVPRQDRPSSDGLAAWRGFLRVHRELIAALDGQLRERHDLPLAWYDVLVQLSEADRELTMGELTERLLISPSTCTRVVERMYAAGLVTRRVDDGDARIRHVGLTTSGWSRLRAAAITHLSGIQRHFADVIGDDAGRLAKQFDLMLDSLLDSPRADTRPGSFTG
jgi:DNA-binding MarR family transcriptional regulator